MSIKTFEEVQSITVPIEKHVCDLCGKVIAPDVPALTITAVKLPHSSPLRPSVGKDWGENVEVCSVDCLVKNIGGVSILFNTKLIPSLNENTKQIPGKLSDLSMNIGALAAEEILAQEPKCSIYH
jgi:hypothetical protein